MTNQTFFLKKYLKLATPLLVVGYFALFHSIAQANPYAISEEDYAALYQQAKTPTHPQSFNAAKKALLSIYHNLQTKNIALETIYCGCPVYVKNKLNKKKLSYAWSKINLKECGYTIRKDQKRAQRVETELVMPAWEFGKDFKCWDQGGREMCSRYNKDFKYREGDLHNLFPSVGEINKDRVHYPFVYHVANPTFTYGKCKMAIDSKNDLAQPPEEARGTIARVYLYMNATYKVPLTKEQLQQYKLWNNTYAPSKIECERNKLIEEKQGNLNPFIDAKRCALAK